MRRKTWVWMGMTCLALLLTTSAHSQDMRRRPGKLSARDRETLAQSREQGRSKVSLIIAAKKGATSEVVSEIEKTAGSVRFRDDDIEYIRAVVPIEQAERIAALQGVSGLKVDDMIYLDDPTPIGGAGTTAAPPLPPGADTPEVNPYMPTKDMGAPQFIQAHPRFDGRGVKIAIVDSGVDVLTPELQSAKTLNGFPTRKIIDWVNMNDPLAAVDPTWVNMTAEVVVSEGSFAFESLIYSGVRLDGRYRFGIFDEAAVNAGGPDRKTEYDISVDGVWCADINRNGVCRERFGILWQRWSNTVWVDSNADRSFQGELPMTDYRLRHDVGLFGIDNPDTPVRESVPFVVQTDREQGFVNIGIVAGAHGTHVAGIAAGKGFFGGAFNGAAPEAQIVSIRVCAFSGGCPTHALLEGMIYAAKKARVDVINMSIGGVSTLNDGQSVFTELYNRLIERTGTQMFISAGNAGPGINTVGDPSTTNLVMSIGAYITKETWLSNYAVDASRDEGLFVFSSRGPTEAGGFKPNIVAPGAAVSTFPGWVQVQGVAGTYQLPPGYAMMNGTSMASPQATGGAALLICAAKQTRTRHDPERLRRAINSSSRFLPAYGAHEQGNGLFQVAAAWQLLRSRLNAFDIVSEAPVNTVLSDRLETPGKGVGIYQREGWTAGESRTLDITLTRTEGSPWPIRYSLNWIGASDIFRSASSIWLQRNVPVTLPVTVSPQTTGVHSAILNLADEAGEGLDYQILNTVVVAEAPDPINAGVVTVSSIIDRPEKSTFFVNVPAGTGVMKVDLSVSSGMARATLVFPEGYPYLQTDLTEGATSYQLPVTPVSGTWEIAVEASSASASPQTVVTATVTLQRVEITPDVWTIDSAVTGTPYRKTFTLTNTMAPFTGGAMGGGSLTSNFGSRPILVQNQPLYYDLNVPSGFTTIEAYAKATDASAVIELHLYDCTAGAESCTLNTSGFTSGPSTFFMGFTNKPGLWRVAVVATHAPSGGIEIDYSDKMANTFYGTATCSDPTRLHPSGEVWTTEVTVRPLVAPDPGRFIRGELRVVGQPYKTLGKAPIEVNF